MQNARAMTKKTLEKLKKRAEFQAKKNLEFFRNLHFSFILRRNKIVAEGSNIRKTDTFAIKTGRQIFGYNHAEIACIKSFKKTGINPKDCQLVSIRLPRRPGGLLLAACCPNCRRAVKSLGITTIYYSQNDGQFGRLDL